MFRGLSAREALRELDMRSAQTRQRRLANEHIRSDAMVICLEAPQPFTVPDDMAFLQITERRYFYFSGDGDIAEILYHDIDQLVIRQKQFNGRVVDVKMNCGESWRFSVLPQTARIMRRWFNRDPVSATSSSGRRPSVGADDLALNLNEVRGRSLARHDGDQFACCDLVSQTAGLVRYENLRTRTV